MDGLIIQGDRDPFWNEAPKSMSSEESHGFRQGSYGSPMDAHDVYLESTILIMKLVDRDGRIRARNLLCLSLALMRRGDTITTKAPLSEVSEIFGCEVGMRSVEVFTFSRS